MRRPELLAGVYLKTGAIRSRKIADEGSCAAQMHGLVRNKHDDRSDHSIGLFAEPTAVGSCGLRPKTLRPSQRHGRIARSGVIK